VAGRRLLGVLCYCRNRDWSSFAKVRVKFRRIFTLVSVDVCVSFQHAPCLLPYAAKTNQICAVQFCSSYSTIK